MILAGGTLRSLYVKGCSYATSGHRRGMLAAQNGPGKLEV